MNNGRSFFIYKYKYLYRYIYTCIYIYIHIVKLAFSPDRRRIPHFINSIISANSELEKERK